MRSVLIGTLRRFRVPVLLFLDSAAWLVAFFAAVALRLETVKVTPTNTLSESDGTIPLYGVLAIAFAAALLHCALAWVLKLHQGRNALAGFEEMFTLASVVFMAGGVVLVANLVADMRYVPTTSIVFAMVLALFLCAWPRALWRLVVVQARPNRHGVISVPVIIAGAGEAGRELISSMQRDPQQNWRPVALVDDDQRKRHFRHRGVAVKGTSEDFARIAKMTGADTLVIAMPSADSSVISRIYEQARAVDLDVKILPSVPQMLGGVDFSTVRDIEPADLLGRHQVQTDVASIAEYLAGRRVLVTGAGGSIGSELARQISQFSPARLIMLDRDESALHSLALSIDGRADLESPDLVLADIRDAQRIHELFDELRPDVVFHAAALKHVNMLEKYPSEAIKTNVLGTINVLDAAHAVGVSRFVNVSTDKAADPANVLGYSKRLAEAVTAERGQDSEGTYISVRFGNVLGTRGSVLTTFAAQIEKGGPITVTDERVTRYFMTVDEAVQLVIQAAAIGSNGEALVLDMGDPVRIIDVAEQMIEQSGRRINIVITGLKPGEKLHEVLFGGDEVDQRPVHPLISHVRVPQLARPASELPLHIPADEVVVAMREACMRLRHPARDEARQY